MFLEGASPADDLEQASSPSPWNRTNRPIRHAQSRPNVHSRRTVVRKMNAVAKGKSLNPRKFRGTVPLNPNSISTKKQAMDTANFVSNYSARGGRGFVEEMSRNSSGDETEDDLPGAFHVYGVNHNNQSDTHPTNFPSSTSSITSELSGHGGKSNHYGYAHLQTATPVLPSTNDGLIDDNVLARIREDAVAAARERIEATAVHAHKIDRGDGDQKCCNRTRKVLLIWNILLFVVAAGVAGVLSTRGRSSGPLLVTTEVPSLSPTHTPDDPGNYDCAQAHAIVNTGVSIAGSTTNAKVTNSLDTCGAVAINGEFGAWYVVEGNDERMMASTCTGTFFDSQVSVYTGSCERMHCVAGNDQMGLGCGNGDQSQVAWHAKANSTYYIYVHGYRNSKGLFTLSVDRMVDNYVCRDAARLVPHALPIFGSTQGATMGNSIRQYCGSARLTSPGVWYFVTGNGDSLQASVLTQNTAFESQISVFRGDDCESLECVAGSHTGYQSWSSENGIKYFIFVNGGGSEPGDFRLQIGEGGDGESDGHFYPGDVLVGCEQAETVLPGFSVYGSTEGSPQYSVGACGSEVFSTSSGIWYTAVGTGRALRASTCDFDNNIINHLDTQISVFGGSCSSLECIGGNDQAGYCGDQSAVSWISEDGEPYYILVHGNGVRQGGFQLTIEEVDINVSEECDTAAEVIPNGASMLGSTIGATSSHIPVCSRRVGPWGEGVWYIIEGRSGPSKNVTVSTCDASSDVASRASVFRGKCGDLLCVENSITTCGAQSSITWVSEANTRYYVYVQGLTAGRRMEVSETGTEMEYFVLTVRDTPLNDICDNAIGNLIPNGQDTFGSTSSATPEVICNGDRMESRGVWYSVIGTGKELVASTCSKFTDFNSRVSVFTGTCGDRTCVERSKVNFDCGEKGSSVRWLSVDGDLYHILVSGIDFEEFGNFALTIGEENDICEGAMGPLPIDTATVVGSTLQATIDNVDVCETSPIKSPGVWYSVVGTGVNLTAMTWNSEFMSQITVYRGQCGKLECVTGIDSIRSSNKSALTWASLEGEVYFILIRLNSGTFGLRIATESTEYGHFLCEDAVGPLGLWSSPITVASHILPSALVEGPSKCGSSIYFGGGAWHDIIGTGSLLYAAVCSSETEYVPQLTVYVGECGELDCIDGNDELFTMESESDRSRISKASIQNRAFENNPELDFVYEDRVQALLNLIRVECINSGSSEAVWYSEKDTVYKVLVHGVAEQGTAYQLSIESIGQ